jgi:hypothetical protein
MISVSKRELFIKSWELFKKNSRFFFNIGILLFTIQHMIPMMIGTFFVPYSMPYFIFHLAYLLVTTGISLWVMMQILKVLRSQSVDSFKNVFQYFPLVFRAIGGSFIITFGLVMIGMVIFTIFSDQMNIDFETATLEVIIGAIASSTMLSVIALGYFMGASYLWIKAYFFIYYIIDKDMGALASIKHSLLVTGGYEADLFIIWIATVVMNFTGILLYGIGLMFTLPYTLIVLSMFYTRYLSEPPK